MFSTTDLQDLTVSLGPSNWLRVLNEHHHEQKNSGLKSRAARDVSHKIGDCISQGKVKDAANWLSLGLFLDSAGVLKHVRRDGVLRASKYQFRSHFLARVLDRSLDNTHDFQISQKDQIYINSVRTLLLVCPAFHRLYVRVIKRLRREQKSVLKTLIARVDIRFAQALQPNYDTDTKSLEHYPQEELAEAVSYLTNLFDELIGIRIEHFNVIDPNGLSKPLYDQLLLDACALIAYRNAEVLVDTFGYRVYGDARLATVTAPDPLLEKAIRGGYIVQAAQQDSDAIRLARKKADHAISLDQLVESVFPNADGKLIRYVERPVPRYLFTLPESDEARKLFQGDTFLKEDMGRLFSAAKAQYTLPEMLMEHPMADGLLVHDVLKIQRFFDFLRKLMAKKILPLIESEPAIVLNSILPVATRDHLRRLLRFCVDDMTSQAFIERIAPAATTRRGVFDLQYQPALSADDWIMAPLNVLCASDLVRNWLFLDKSRGSHRNASAIRQQQQENGRISFPQEILAESIRKHTSRIIENRTWNWLGQTLEVDIAAVIGSYLLLVEFKDVYHPCSVFELRTSYDHMQKARKQLSRWKQTLLQPNALDVFLRSLGWRQDGALDVLTCICSSNRIFSGYAFDGHPVRNVYEMVNFFESGTGVFLGEEISAWAGEHFESSDLAAYLKHHPFYEPLFDRLVRVYRPYKADKAELVFDTFGLPVPNP